MGPQRGAADPAAGASWGVAVHLTHPQVPCWSFGPAQAQRLAEALPALQCRICPDRESFRAALQHARIALVWSFSQDEFALAPDLCLVATPAAGRDYFRVTPPPGVQVLYGRFHGEIMAETALGLLLGMSRGLLPAVTTYADRPWPRAELARQMRPLRGSHLVILGFGRIGQWIGRLAKPFGVRLTGIRRRVVPGEVPGYFAATDRVLPVRDLEAVLPQADHLLLVLPDEPATNDLLDGRRLALLPAHATLTNLGRGNAVNEAALVAALRGHRLAAACLDVCRTEPLGADSPLRDCPNLWLFPHAAAISPTYMDLFVDDFAAQFRAWQQNAES